MDIFNKIIKVKRKKGKKQVKFSRPPILNRYRNKKEYFDRPDKNSIIYIVRISKRKQAKKAQIDYIKFKNQIKEKKEAIWDKDSNNKIKVGNWFGFIVGPVGKEIVELYLVISEKSIEYRAEHWAKDESYTNQKTNIKSMTREVIILKNQQPITKKWKEWKKKVKYNDKYTPRGTISAKSPF